jgi:Condensation domain
VTEVTGTGVRAEPASPGQRLLWIMDRYRGGNGMMGVPLLYRLRGRLDEGALAGAVAGVSRRHEALRTTFGMRRRALHQFIHEPGATVATHRITDLRGAPDPERAVATQVREFLRADLDTASSPLATALWRLGPEDQVLVLNIHHLVTDAWSNMLISRDLAALYTAAVRGTPAMLPAVGWQQADFVRWQARHLAGGALTRHQAYWNDELRGAALPKLPDRRDQAGNRGRPTPGALMSHEWFALPADLITSLRATAREQRCTLFTLLLAAMLATLRELTGQDDVSIGSIFANRAQPQARQTVGFLANMVVVRSRTPATAAHVTTLAGVRRSALGALGHEELPFLSIPFGTMAGTEAPATRGRPEDVVFHMLAVPPDAGFGEIRFDGLDTEPLRIPDGMGNRFDLEVLIVPSRHGLDGVVRYTAERFEASYIRRFAATYLAAAGNFASLACPRVRS